MLELKKLNLKIDPISVNELKKIVFEPYMRSLLYKLIVLTVVYIDVNIKSGIEFRRF